MTMNCPSCRQAIAAAAGPCPHCGAVIGELDATLARTEAGLDADLARIEHDLDRDLARAIGEPAPSPVRPTPLRARGETAALPFAQLAQAGVRAAVPDGVPFGAEIHQMAGFVCQSPFVQSNAQYRQRAETTTLILDATPSVNAFATDMVLETTAGEQLMPPSIVFQGGAAWVGIAGSAAAARFAEADDGRTLLETVRAIGVAIVERGQFGHDEAIALLDQLGLDGVHADGSPHGTAARSYASAMFAGVLAHELGHIALGHTLGSEASLEVSRNQEREADSFASSVLTTSPFRDYLTLGNLTWWMVLTWVDHAAQRTEAGTHPHSRERLASCARDHAGELRRMGITWELLESFLPA